MNEILAVPTRHKLDIDGFRCLAEAGVIGWKDRIELIDGELIDMAPIGTEHYGTVNWLNQALVLACQGRAIVSIQNPAPLDRYNHPQPDAALYRYRPDYYRTDPPPGPADTLALVEVADSSLAYDSTVKLALYARFGVPEYWIVDLRNRRLLVHRDPGPDGYAEVTVHEPGTPLTLTAAPDIVLDLAALFP